MALPGEGTKLQYKVATVFTDLANIEEIDGPESTVAAVKTTNLGSTHHTYRPSKTPDPGKLSFKVQYDPNDTGHQDMFARINTPGTIDDFKVVFNDGKVTPANSTFSGFVTKFKPTGEKVEENLIAEMEVQLNTMPVYTPGADS